MRGFKIYKGFRTSLTLRVLSTTLVLTTIVIWVVGSALLNRISTGVVNEKIKSALSESTLAVYSAQFRFTSGGVTDAALKKIAQEVVNAKKAIRATESGREVILIRSAKNLDPEVAIDTVSNRVSYESIPSELRDRLLNSGDPVWARSIIEYADGHKVPGIVVGDKLSIPRVGPYDIYFLFSFESQVNTLNLVKNYLFLAGFILLLLIVGITYLVIRQVIEPVRDAAKIAEEFTAGKLEKRISVVGSDEISRLGISFNAMATAIEQQIKRLENLSKVQQRFVSDVSHELRTPLTTIRMASDLIYAYRDKFEPNISRSAELLQSQIDRFELLLADLLEVSRFDATEAAMEISEIDLNEMVARCITDLSLISAEKNVVVNLEKDLVNPIVSVDARRIERILRNLLTNAIDHANEKPVDVTIKSNSSALSVSIRDYGIGIDPAQVPRVFDRFWRADPARARSRGGTGLGLSIAQEDAHLHDGTLKAWGKLNEGAQFILTLPRKIGWKIEAEPIELLTTK